MATTKRTRRTKAATKTSEKVKVSREPTKAQTTRLISLAREINVRLQKAEKMDDQATDHRLAAALRLKEAQDTCKETHVKFKDWVDENVEWSYETARKLVRIGSSDDPASALEDLRERTALQMRESRERSAKKTASERKAITGPAATSPQKVIDEALASLDDDKAVKVIAKAAKARGVAAPDGGGGDIGDLRHAVAAFDALSATDKLHLMAHAARATGADISIFDEDIEDAAETAAKKSAKKTGGRKGDGTAAPSRSRRRASARASA